MGFFRFFIQYNSITVLQLYSFTVLQSYIKIFFIYPILFSYFFVFLTIYWYICKRKDVRTVSTNNLLYFSTIILLSKQSIFPSKTKHSVFLQIFLKNFYTFSVLFQNTDYLLIERNMNGFQKLIVSATLD